MSSSPSLSAKSYNELVKWADQEADRLLEMYMRAAIQDGYLPMTEPPNELEELDTLTGERPMRQAILAQPPDPEWEAVRSQAQQQEQRYIQLVLKYRGDEHATNGQYPA